MTNHITCPYCGRQQEIDYDSCHAYDGEPYYQECRHCEKTFVYEITTVRHYEVFPAPCLNGEAEHDYYLTDTFPRELSRMRCDVCYHERLLTDDERETFGIGTREDYFKSLKR
jgi:hypothetical protein